MGPSPLTRITTHSKQTQQSRLREPSTYKRIDYNKSQMATIMQLTIDTITITYTLHSNQTSSSRADLASLLSIIHQTSAKVRLTYSTLELLADIR